MQILVSSLLPQDDEASRSDIQQDGKGAYPPNDWVTQEVDLSMILDPETVEYV